MRERERVSERTRGGKIRIETAAAAAEKRGKTMSHFCMDDC